MILKWIACTPTPGLEAANMECQRIWNRETFARENVENYIMAEGNGQVQILMEWPDMADLDRFMTGTHEWLLREYPPGETLKSFTVAYYDFVEPIVTPPAFDRIYAGEAMVRLVSNRVPETVFDEFVRVLREVWNPGIAQAVGFLGGRVWRRRDDPTEVLMTSYFRNGRTDLNYEQNIRPLLTVEGRRIFDLAKGLFSLSAKVTELYRRS